MPIDLHDPAVPPHRNDRGFHNPPGSPRQRGRPRDWWDFFKRLNFGDAAVRKPDLPPGHLLDETSALAGLESLAGRDTLTWLGHACFLLRLSGLAVLTDPYLSDYASPVQGLGPKRYAGTGLPLARLPKIDVILLSHNHYDHLDAPVLRQLARANPDTAAFVPLGLAPILKRLGFRRVQELDWGQAGEALGTTVTAVPAVHFSSRTPFDRNQTLWCGFKLEANGRRVYFAGDTGWGGVFQHAGARFGPFDLALVPIGAYEPRSLMQAVHANPEEGLRIGLAMRARRIVAMHWGTIALTTEPAFEPPQRFVAAARAAQLGEDRAWVMAIGETRAIDD